MGIGAGDILVGVWRFLHISVGTSTKCVQKHPFVSGSLLFLCILYAFFNLFVFFAPFLFCVTLLLRGFWTSGGLTILEEKRDQKPRRNQIPRKKPEAGSSDLQKQKSRRTNVKKFEWDSQTEKEKKLESTTLPTCSDHFISSTLMLDKEARALNSRREIDRAIDHGESSTAKMTVAEVLDGEHSILDSDRDILSSDSSDDESEKCEGGGSMEEAAQENGNKAVQWTDDDQRNLMDLGFSEIERNKRLESLIARRRARKLFKMQIEKGLIDLDNIIPGQLAPLYVAKANQYIAEMDGMETPGSAPSVYFPAKNPFDLPYDPHEEKPDLKTDSFQQEFTAVTQKDMLYCRHESFCYGAAYALEARKRAMDEVGFSRFNKQSEMGPHDSRIERMLSSKGEHDELVETIMAEVEEEMSHVDSTSEVCETETTSTSNQPTTSTEAKGKRIRKSQSVTDVERMSKATNDQIMYSRSEAHMEQHVTDDSNDESTSSAMSDEDDHNFNANTSRFTQNAVPKVGRVPPKPMHRSDHSSSAERGRLEERLLYAERGPCHTPTYSIASDLQVEVSDAGSPPLTVDGANSPTDRESLNLDGDFEREYMWAASSQSSRAEESEPKFGNMRGLSERDFAGLGFSGHSKNTKSFGESSMSMEQSDELDDTDSLSSSRTDSRAHSTSYDEKAFDDVRQVVEEVGKPSTSGFPNSLLPEDQVENMKSSEKLVAQLKESSSPHDETTKKVIVQAANTVDHLKDEKTKDRHEEAKSGLSTPSEGTVGKLSTKEDDSVNHATQSIMDNKKLHENEGDLQKDQHENTAKSTKEGNLLFKKPAEDVSQNGIEDPSDVKKQVEVIGSLSQKDKETSAELKRSSEETGSLSQNAIKGTAEIKTSALDSGGILLNATGAPVALKIPAEDVSRKGTEHASDIKNNVEAIGSLSQKATGTSAELNNSSTETRILSQNATDSIREITTSALDSGSVIQKATGAPAELNIPAEDVSHKGIANPLDVQNQVEVIGSLSQKGTETSAEMKNSSTETGSLSQNATEAIKEITTSALDSGSVLQKATGAPAELNIPAEDVSHKGIANPLDVKNQVEVIGSLPRRATETSADLQNSSGEIRSLSQKAIEATSEIKTPDSGSVLQTATSAPVELKRPAKDIGMFLQDTPDTTAELKRPAEVNASVLQNKTEAALENTKTNEDIANVSHKASEIVADLKSPAEKSENVSGKTKEVAAMLRGQAEETGIVSQKATEVATDMKSTTEKIGNLAQKANEAVAELKNTSEKIGDVSQNTVKATAESKSLAEGNVSGSHTATEPPAALQTPAEEIKT